MPTYPSHLLTRLPGLAPLLLGVVACATNPAADGGSDGADAEAGPDDAPADGSEADGPEEADVSDQSAETDGDGGDDGGTPMAAYCRPCRWNAECDPGLCLALEGALEMSCAPPCDEPDDCPSGGECVARSSGRYCLPASRTCIESPLGSPCRSWGCSGRYDTCTDPAGTPDGRCSRTCERDLDCDPGWNRCADRGDGLRVCLPPLASPPERCGADPAPSGVGSLCGPGGGCDAEAPLCLADDDPRLPALCSRTCAADPDCPDGSLCLPVGVDGSGAPRHRCLPEVCRCLTRIPGSLLDDALDALDLERCDLRYSAASLDRFGPELAHDRFRLPWFDAVHGDWLRGPSFVRQTVAALDAAATPRGLLLRAAALLGREVDPAPPDLPVSPSDPLVEAVADLIEAHGGTADRSALRAALAGLPSGLPAALAPVVVALDRAAAARDRAVERLGGASTLLRSYFNDTAPLVLPGFRTVAVTSRQVQDFLIDDFGYLALFQAAADLLAALETADLERFAGSEGFDVGIDTPLGRIALRDARPTTHDDTAVPGPVLFVLDTGGDDTWTIPAGATVSERNPVSLAVDLGGEDLYAYVERPGPGDVPPRLPADQDGRYAGDGDYGPFSLSTRGRQGSGTLGIGMLLDLGDDNDEYRSLRMSQGWGALGVGILYDAGGDDLYRCEAGCQGGALFGVGILHDAGDGIDRYEGYHAVQGFGYVRGAGLLYDAGGDDAYRAEPDDVLYYNPQDPHRSNSSMSQGMGFGRRSEVAFGGDGVLMSGGIGVLRDAAGNDGYVCAVFGQGSGYWFGTGILADGGGGDTYDARWYVQAGAAHYALAALWDAAGDDVYNRDARRLNVTLGGGHDFSSAFLLDDAGNDVYGAPNLSLGAGNEDGFGLFLDRSGDDRYEAASDFSLGNAFVDPGSGARTGFPTAGLFLDADGTDTYLRPDAATPGDDRIWVQRMHADQPFEWGAGVDRAAGDPGI